jgi:hypothetical protein
MVVYREPAALAVLDARDGKTIVRVETCGDADDVFFDAKRQRAYISCGEGVIDVVQRQGDTYASMSRIRTVPGARTALFVPELDRLFLAVRAGGGDGAAICRDGSPRTHREDCVGIIRPVIQAGLGPKRRAAPRSDPSEHPAAA